MSNTTHRRTAVAQLALNSIPPSLREVLIRDSRMRESYDIKTDTVLSVGESEFAAKVSQIVRGVSRAFEGDPEATVKDLEGNDWSIEWSASDEHPTLVFVDGGRHLGMHAWLTLSPNRGTRLSCLEALAADAGLSRDACAAWRHILEERRLKGEEVPDFLSDLLDTAHVQEELLASGIRTRGLDSRSAAPRSRRYFERLVGLRGESASIEAHSAAGARERLAELAAWRPREGFLQSLYMASHAGLTAQIPVDSMSREELVQALDFILHKGDRVSQLGAIEVGLRVSASMPEVNPTVKKLVSLIRSDDTTRPGSGFRTYSLLYMLVFGELSIKQQLADDPPFYRRLAASAQAGLIQRQMVAERITLNESAVESRTGEYLVRSLVDLRLEPRRHPTLGFAAQLQAHFLSRVLRATARYENELEEELIGELGYLLGSEELRQAGDAFVLYTPGVLEEAEESRALPAEFRKAIQAQLETDNPVEPVDFNALRTSMTSFHICGAQADLARVALERSNGRLANVQSRSELLATLAGLASAAAIARSEALADTLSVVVKKYRRDAEFPITMFEAMQVMVVAAASRSEQGDWVEFVGDCLTELAFGDLAESDGEILHGYVRRFCDLVPELWKACGRGDAALMAYNGSMSGQ